AFGNGRAPLIYANDSGPFDNATGTLVLHPSTINIPSHPWNTGDKVELSRFKGADSIPRLPSGDYYVIKVDSNTIRLASSQANAMANKAIVFVQPAQGKYELEDTNNESETFMASDIEPSMWSEPTQTTHATWDFGMAGATASDGTVSLY